MHIRLVSWNHTKATVNNLTDSDHIIRYAGLARQRGGFLRLSYADLFRHYKTRLQSFLLATRAHSDIRRTATHEILFNIS